MKTGDALKKARMDVGITQAELAKRLGVTPQTISQYERGHINPKIETLLKFANALEIDFISLVNQVDYLEDGKGNIFPGAEQMREIQAAQQEYQEIMKNGISEDNVQRLNLIKEKFEDIAHNLYDTELLSNFHELQDADKEKVISYCKWLVNIAQHPTESPQDAAGNAPEDTNPKKD